MKIGALFPQFEIGLDPITVRDFGRATDELGYRHLTAFDQVIGLNEKSRSDWRYVHDAEDMFHEIFVVFKSRGSFDPCGEVSTNRGKRIDEQIDVLRKLWTAGLVTYEGKFHRI